MFYFLVNYSCIIYVIGYMIIIQHIIVIDFLDHQFLSYVAGDYLDLLRE